MSTLIEAKLWSGIVVFLTLLCVTQDTIGFLYFLESTFVPAFVGMMLAGQSTIGLFDLVFGSCFGYTQYLIIVFHKNIIAALSFFVTLFGRF